MTARCGRHGFLLLSERNRGTVPVGKRENENTDKDGIMAELHNDTTRATT